MTTETKRGRGRPRKEDVEKAQVAAKIAPPKETKIYTGTVTLTRLIQLLRKLWSVHLRIELNLMTCQLLLMGILLLAGQNF